MLREPAGRDACATETGVTPHCRTPMFSPIVFDAVCSLLSRTSGKWSGKKTMNAKPPASNVEWIAWARKDPLYAVATCPNRDREGAAPWSDAEFYALGESDWTDFRRRWE